VFPTKIAEGHWGGYGQIGPFATILARLTRDPDRAGALAATRIAASRAETPGRGDERKTADPIASSTAGQPNAELSTFRP